MMKFIVACAVALCFGACGGSSSGGGSTGGAPAGGASQSGAKAAEASSAPIKVDMNKIFPAGPGRDLVLENCQNCHTFVPIVVLQMDKDAWYRSSLDHRGRVPNLTDDQFKTLYEYLVSNFGPDHAVPTLPKELLKTWTSY